MITLYIVNVITLIWFPLYRYSVSVQVFFCVNFTTNRLLTTFVVSCYSRVCACIKGWMKLSLDILCCLWLGFVWCVAWGTYTGSHTLSTRVDLWIFPSCFTWQPVSSVVGLQASWLPQCAPRVNPWRLVNITVLCGWHGCGSCVIMGCPLCWHGGRGLTCVNYCCSHPSLLEGKFRN